MFPVLICDGSMFSCLTLSKKKDIWVYWWKGNAKIKHKLGRVCSKKKFSALLYNFSTIFKVEELNVPIVSVEYGRECIALAAYCVRLKHVFLPQGLLNTHRRPWQYSMCMYTLTDSHTNSQLVYENGRWVRTQAKEHTHLLNVSGGAGILGRGERSCQAF